MSDSLRPHGLWPIRLFCPRDFPGKSAGVDCHFLLQGIFPTKGSNPGLLHCRPMLYCLSHQGSPKIRISESHSVMSDSLKTHGLYSPWILQARILEWVSFPFSRGSSQPRDWTQVSRIAGRRFTIWATREAQYSAICSNKMKLTIETGNNNIGESQSYYT